MEEQDRAVDPLDALVAAVRETRSRVIDRWEAAALIESIGYTDARVEREFGYPDTLAVAESVFARLGDDSAAQTSAASVDRVRRHWLADLADSIASSVVYAIPWLAMFVVERMRPSTFRLPGSAGPALTVALMSSLAISGGFIQAIARRGRFYIGMQQPELAALVTTFLFRLGATAAVLAALAGVALGWYFSLFTWPYLALAADALVLLCLLWMTCGILTLRHEQWRTPLAFAAGGAAFVVLRAAGCDALVSQLLAAATVLAAAMAQVPSVFRLTKGDQSGVVPLPRLTILLYRVLPYFWYGAAYFCFLFTDRFAAGVAVADLAGEPFGLRPGYKLGMDIALMVFLLASAGVEYANLRFVRNLEGDAAASRDPHHDDFRRRIRRRHAAALGLAAIVYILVALIVAVTVHRLLGPPVHPVWRTAAIGSAGYLMLALGLLNSLVLFSLNRPWTPVKCLTAGLAANIGVGFVSSHVYGSYYAVAGLVVGAAIMCVTSTVAIRRAAAHAAWTVAAG